MTDDEIDEVIAFTEKQLGLELMSWQRQFVRMALRGERPALIGPRIGKRTVQRFLETAQGNVERGLPPK